MKSFVAVKAFIINNDKVLILQESPNFAVNTNHGKYDVVGGRLEPGERYEEALRREVFEETGLEIKIGKPFYVAQWDPVVQGEQWHITGIYFVCTTENSKVTLSAEHQAYAWIDPKKYKEYEIIENIKKVFEAYLTL